MAKKAQEFAKYAHAMIFVVKANDPRLKLGRYVRAVRKVTEHFWEDGKNNVCLASISHSTVRMLIARKESRMTNTKNGNSVMNQSELWTKEYNQYQA